MEDPPPAHALTLGQAQHMLLAHGRQAQQHVLLVQPQALEAPHHRLCPASEGAAQCAAPRAEDRGADAAQRTLHIGALAALAALARRMLLMRTCPMGRADWLRLTGSGSVHMIFLPCFMVGSRMSTLLKRAVSLISLCLAYQMRCSRTLGQIAAWCKHIKQAAQAFDAGDSHLFALMKALTLELLLRKLTWMGSAGCARGAVHKHSMGFNCPCCACACACAKTCKMTTTTRRTASWADSAHMSLIFS